MWLSTLLVLLGLGASISKRSSSPNGRDGLLLGIQFIILVISIILVINFKVTTSDFQYGEKLLWIPSLDIHYQLGVDGFSVLFLPFSAVLFIAAVMGNLNAIRTLPNAYFSLLLIMHRLVGVFTALDTVLFFCFGCHLLFPCSSQLAFVLVDNRRYAGMNMLFMLVGGVPLLLGFLLLGINESTGFI